MATNKPYGDNARKGEVKGRAQVFNKHIERWTKTKTKSGKFIDQKSDKDHPFKGVRKHK